MASVGELTQCFLFLFVFLLYIATLPTVDDNSLSARMALAENASSDHASQCSQSEENLDAKVER